MVAATCWSSFHRRNASTICSSPGSGTSSPGMAGIRTEKISFVWLRPILMLIDGLSAEILFQVIDLIGAQIYSRVLREGVLGLADLIWKRRRLRKFIQTQLIADMFDARTPAFNKAWGFTAFTHYLRTEPETCFEKHARKYLRPDKINYLKQNFGAQTINQHQNGSKPSQKKSFRF